MRTLLGVLQQNRGLNRQGMQDRGSVIADSLLDKGVWPR